MSLINITSIQRQALQMLSKMSPSAGLELLSYKRNRTVSIVVLSEERYFVRERGYVNQEVTVSLKELGKVLKTMIKREFPRSRKVRIFKFASPDELERERIKI